MLPPNNSEMPPTSLKDILDGDTNPDDFKTVSASFGSFVMTNMRESDDEMSLGEASNQSIAIFLRSLVLVAAEQNQWQVVLQMLNDTRFSDNEVAQLLNKLIHDYQ